MLPVIIKINGEDQYFHYNNYAIAELQKWRKATNENTDLDDTNLSLLQLIEKNFLLGVAVITYCGLVGYKYSKFEVNHGFTIESVAEALGNVNESEWLPIWEAYKEATGMASIIKNQPEVKEKKSQHSKKSLNTQSA